MTLSELRDRINAEWTMYPQHRDVEVCFTYSFLETATKIDLAGLAEVDTMGDGELEMVFELSSF